MSNTDAPQSQATITQGESTVPQGTTVDEAADKFLEMITVNDDSEQQEVEDPTEEGQPETSGEEQDETDVSEDEQEEESEEETPEEEEASEEETEDVYQVTIKNEDGEDEEVEVNVDELIQGYMRTKDYQRKRSAEGKEQKAALSELTKVRDSLEATLAAQISIEEQTLQQLEGQLARTQAERPELYPELHYRYLQLKGQVTERQGMVDQLRQSYLAQREEETTQRVNQSLEELRNIYPDWAEKQQVLSEYLGDQGFTNDDVKNMVNPKIVELVDKARLYDKNQGLLKEAKFKKLKRKVPKTLDAGVSGKRDAVISKRASSEVKQRAAQSGSIEDAAEALHRMFQN